jgi:hypothetical protein
LTSKASYLFHANERQEKGERQTIWQSGRCAERLGKRTTAGEACSIQFLQQLSVQTFGERSMKSELNPRGQAEGGAGNDATTHRRMGWGTNRPNRPVFNRDQALTQIEIRRNNIGAKSNGQSHRRRWMACF